ncbi:MAG: alpha/beta hydrolase [Pseudomonadales bacterium]|nr:alpha/beta hydrolase [Pseudomonadales bacterium]
MSRTKTKTRNLFKLSYTPIFISLTALTGCGTPLFWAETTDKPGVQNEYVEIHIGDDARLGWDLLKIEEQTGALASINIQPNIGTVDTQTNSILFTPKYTSSYTANFTGNDTTITETDVDVVVLREYCTGNDNLESPYAVELDIQVPNPTNFPNGNYPAVVFIHGGGWSGGDYTELYKYLPEATTRGYVAVSVSYRLNIEGQIVWPGHIQDVKCAVRWLRSNASTLNINPAAIAAVGHSAGGHLAAMLGVTDSSNDPVKQAVIDGFNNGDVQLIEGGNIDINDSVQAVVSMAGVHNLESVYFDNPTQVAADTLEGLLGEVPIEGEENLTIKQASPVYFVDAESAAKPFLILNSEEDFLVPTSQGCELKLAIEAAGGTDATFLLYPTGGHLSYIDYRNVKQHFAGGNIEKTVLNVFSFLDYHLKSGPAPSYSDPMIGSADCEEIIGNTE